MERKQDDHQTFLTILNAQRKWYNKFKVLKEGKQIKDFKSTQTKTFKYKAAGKLP